MHKAVNTLSLTQFGTTTATAAAMAPEQSQAVAG